MLENQFAEFLRSGGTMLSDELDVQTIRTPKRVIVRIVGDAGIGNVARLDAELTSIASEQPKLVVIDLTDVTFIASRGMGVLMSFHRRMSIQKGKMRVAAPPSRVRDAMEIARLHTVLDMYESLEAAQRGGDK